MVFFCLRRQIILPRDKSLGKTPSAVQINANTLPEASTRGRLGTCVGAVGDDDGRGPDDRGADAPPSRFGQKNNNQLATGAVKAGCGRQESIENYISTTTGDKGSVQ